MDRIETVATQAVTPATPTRSPVSIEAIENWAAETAPKLGVSLYEAIVALYLAHKEHGIPVVCRRSPLYQECRPQE